MQRIQLSADEQIKHLQLVARTGGDTIRQVADTCSWHGHPEGRSDDAAMPDWDDPYRILGIGEAASIAEIRQAYRRAALRYHPDAYEGDPIEAAQLFHHAHEAYKEALRAAILRQRAAREAGEGPKVPRPAPQAPTRRRQYNPPPITSADPTLFPRRTGFRRRRKPGGPFSFYFVAVALVLCLLLAGGLAFIAVSGLSYAYNAYLESEDGDSEPTWYESAVAGALALAPLPLMLYFLVKLFQELSHLDRR